MVDETKNDTKATDAKAEVASATKAAAPAPARTARTPAPATRTEDVVVRGRVADDTAAATKKKVEKTGAHTHVATARGYSIVDGGGVLVEPGEFVPEGTPVSLAPDDADDQSDPRAVAGVGWMKKVSKKEARDLQVSDEATDLKPKDVDLTQASKAGLEALALLHGINVGGLDKEGLIEAINAHRAKDAG